MSTIYVNQALGADGLQGTLVQGASGAVPAGFVGEEFTAVSGSVNLSATNTDVAGVTLAIGKGTWLVHGATSLSITNNTDLFGSTDYLEIGMNNALSMPTVQALEYTRYALTGATSGSLMGTSASKQATYMTTPRVIYMAAAGTLYFMINASTGASNTNFTMNSAIRAIRIA